MDKTTIFIIIAIILAAVLFFVFFSGTASKVSVEPTALPEGIVLFYGQECPHCKNVEDFIAANNIDQKVKSTKLEVPFLGKTSPELVANAELAGQLAQKCKLDVGSGVGIPFLYDGKGNCLVGDADVIKFFKNEAGIK